MTSWLEAGLSNALLATVLAVVASVVVRIFRRPQVAFVLWLLVLAKLLMPPLVSVPLAGLEYVAPHSPAEYVISPVDSKVAPIPSSASPLPAEVVVENLTPSALEDEAQILDVRRNLTDAIPSETIAPVTWSQAVPFVFWAWAIGSGLWFALAAVRIVRFHRFLRHAERATPELQDEVARLAGRMGLRSLPRVRLVQRRISPLVWAMFGKATLLLPAELLRDLTAEQRATLLAHELAHLARRDHLVRWLELISLGLYWWHPVAWWARRNVEQAEEHCCDAYVMRVLPELRRAYAETMLATVEFLAASRPAIPLGASGFSQLHTFTRRLEMILDGTVVRRVNWPLRLTLVMLAVLVLPLSICLMGADATTPKTETEAGAKPDAVEQRLDRLEKMIYALTDEMRVSRNRQALLDKQDVVRNPALQAATAPKDASEENNQSGAVRDYLGEELASLLHASEATHQKLVTNLNNCHVTDHQLGKMKKAYAAGTVTLDQLLQAQRNSTGARFSYARTVAGLCDNPAKRRYLFASSSLNISNNSLKEARATWEEIHRRVTAGVDDSPAAREEAQAREQYFQFKHQTQVLINEFFRCKEGLEADQAPVSSSSQWPAANRTAPPPLTPPVCYDYYVGLSH